MQRTRKATFKGKLEQHPFLYLNVLAVKRIGHWSRDWIVTRKTDVTIEGFPRCGNSFAHSAFRVAQGEDKARIATHVHSSAQVLRSVTLGKPTMVLIREPRDACLSLAALSREIKKRENDESLESHSKREIMNNLADYMSFYRNILPVINKVTIADFELVKKDFGRVIQRMNFRFGKNFRLYENSSKNDAEVFETGGFHLSPNKMRDGIKERLRSAFNDPKVIALAEEAETVHQEILAFEREQAFRHDPPS